MNLPMSGFLWFCLILRGANGQKASMEGNGGVGYAFSFGVSAYALWEKGYYPD